MIRKVALVQAELIETLWNVNGEHIERYNELIAELIETLWNVNTVRKSALYFFLSELIETLWNVNERKNRCRLLRAKN